MAIPVVMLLVGVLELENSVFQVMPLPQRESGKDSSGRVWMEAGLKTVGGGIIGGMIARWEGREVLIVSEWNVLHVLDGTNILRLFQDIISWRRQPTRSGDRF